ncbi:MAG: MFS transporter, partial [Thermoplasmata archaeon]
FPIVYFLGPLAGGATIQNLGYDVLFSVALLLLILNSAIVLLTWKKNAKKYAPKVRFTEMRSFTSGGFFLEGVQEGVFAIALPLATFFFVGEEFELGKILAVLGVAGGVMSVVAGKLSDRKGNRMLFINLAALVCGPLLFLAAFVSDLLLFGLAIGAIYFFLPLLAIFLFALAVDRAPSSANAIMGRELMLNAGRTLGAFLCLLLTLFMSVQGTFVIAGASLLLVPLLRLRK